MFLLIRWAPPDFGLMADMQLHFCFSPSTGEALTMNKMIMTEAAVCLLFLNGCVLGIGDPVWERASIWNDPEAQYMLGFRYANGIGVTRDDCEAVKWYRKSAEQGNPDGSYLLGLAYASGQCMERDDGQAFSWYEKAAYGGIADAQFKVGFAYGQGVGVARDDSKSVWWFNKAASQGHADAQFMMGLAYASGTVVEQNDAKALALFQSACNQINKNACAALQKMKQRMASRKN